jgi:hypothetical protein
MADCNALKLHFVTDSFRDEAVSLERQYRHAIIAPKSSKLSVLNLLYFTLLAIMEIIVGTTSPFAKFGLWA